MCTKSRYSCTLPNLSTIHFPAAYYRCYVFQTEAPIRHFCSTIAIYFPITSSMFDANLKPCKANFAPTLVAEILSKAMNRRLSCRLRITMEINVWIELLLLCLKNATHFENVELVSMLWAKSKRVCAAGIRSVFMRYGLVVSNKDLKYSINYVNKPKKFNNFLILESHVTHK